MRIILLLIPILLISCSPEKRIARIAKKYNLIQTDTIFRKDTVLVEGARKDTTIHYLQNDTFVLREKNMVYKYYYNVHDSTVYLDGECLPDTIIREVPITVNSINVQDKGVRQRIIDYVINNLLTLLLMILVAYIAYRNRK